MKGYFVYPVVWDTRVMSVFIVDVLIAMVVYENGGSISKS